MLSARNQLAAVVKSVKLGNVMAEVVVDVAGTEVVAIITRGSAECSSYSQGIMSRRSSSQQQSSDPLHHLARIAATRAPAPR